MPQLCLPEGTSVERPAFVLGDNNVYGVDAAEPVTLTVKSTEGSLNILVLPSELADQAWVLETPRGRDLVLSVDPLWAGEDGLLAGRSLGFPFVRRYASGTGQFEDVDIPAPETANVRVALGVERIRNAQQVPASFGSLAGRAAAPSDAAIAELAEVYRVDLTTAGLLGGEGHSELEIEWAGDVARLLVDGSWVADRFWDGSPWVIDTHDAGIGPDSELQLQILPLAKDAKVGLPLEAQQRRDALDGDLAGLDKAELLHWTTWQENPA